MTDSSFARPKSRPFAVDLPAAWFSALSRALGYFPRLAGGSEPALLFCVLLLAALSAERPPIDRPILAGVLAGLTLACGPYGWLALLLLGLALAAALAGSSSG